VPDTEIKQENKTSVNWLLAQR